MQLFAVWSNNELSFQIIELLNKLGSNPLLSFGMFSWFINLFNDVGLCILQAESNKLAQFEDVMSCNRALGVSVVWGVDWVLIFSVDCFRAKAAIVTFVVRCQKIKYYIWCSTKLVVLFDPSIALTAAFHQKSCARVEKCFSSAKNYFKFTCCLFFYIYYCLLLLGHFYFPL